MLDDKSVDAVIIATPVHWHAPGTILACEAGKHVYVEKPCSHDIREGRLMVEAARRTHRVVQHGTQVRSTSTIREGIRLLREGIIGDVLVAKAWPYHDNLFSGWNWFRHFGTGEIGNDGIHDIDYARWGLGVETHPSFIAAAGGRYLYDNGAEFPDTQQVCFEYPAGGNLDKKRLLIYEERLWSTNFPHDCDSGAEFYGTKGQMFLSRRGKIEVLADGNQPRSVDVPLEEQNTEDHVADFLDAIRSGRKPSADIEIAHHTTSFCHLGNIANRLGRSLRFDAPQERFIDDQEADAMLHRSYRDGHWAAPHHV
jgi:predicted dehydrogenase